MTDIVMTKENTPVKAKIVKVGMFTENGVPIGWQFDGCGRGIGIDFRPHKGGTLVGGYTFGELREIAACREESLRTEG